MGWAGVTGMVVVVDVHDVVTAVLWTVCIEGGEKHISVFAYLCEEELFEM